ncbi:MAG: hypothetical protein RLZZ622_1143, partial [Planctomycetota bacterium]
GSRLGLPGVPVCSTQQEKPAVDGLAAGASRLTVRKPHAAKPEAQAEGNRVFRCPCAFPRLAPQASRCPGLLETTRKTGSGRFGGGASRLPVRKPLAAKPEAQAEGNRVFRCPCAFPRLAPRASRCPGLLETTRKTGSDGTSSTLRANPLSKHSLPPGDRMSPMSTSGRRPAKEKPTGCRRFP